MKRFHLLILLLIAVLLFISCDGDTDDDDDNDNDDNDAGDDDTGDDDDDDDTSDTPDSPYENMSPSGKPIDDILGISTHMSRNPEYSRKREMEIEHLVEAGIGLVRADFNWDRMEPEDDQWYFDGYDVMVDLVLEADRRLMAILAFGVDWAMPGGGHSEIEMDQWAEFNGNVAARYGDRIHLYEIWNEQNISRFWKPEPDPDRFGTLMKTSYEAVHANDPNAEVVFGGLSPLNDHILGEYGLWSFLMQVYEYHPDICEYMDGMAIHPYTFFQQSMPERTVDFGIWAYPNMTESIAQVRELLELAGCPDLPIHLTEAGWPDLLIGRNRQAPFLSRGIMLAAASHVDSFVWYTFWDGSGNASLPTEDAFGLLTWYDDDPRPKPSFYAMKGIHRILGASRFAGVMSQADGWSEERWGLAFVDEEGTWTIGIWHTLDNLSEPVTITVPLHPEATGQWELYNQEGNLLTTGDCSAGDVEVRAFGWVQYLKFSTGQ